MADLDRSEPKVTNFGLFSKPDRDRVAALLDSLGVRYYFEEEIRTEEALRDWEPWDELAAEPHKAINCGRTLMITTKLGWQSSIYFPSANSARRNRRINFAIHSFSWKSARS